MIKPSLLHPSAWLLALALATGALTAQAATGSPEDLAKVQVQLQEAITAVDAARASFDSGQAKLAAARINLDKADADRAAAEAQLARTEAKAAGGRVTRAEVDADRDLAEKAALAVSAVRQEIADAEADVTVSQQALMAAKTAVDKAAASAAAYLGEEAPAN
jgi:hypothetical protein